MNSLETSRRSFLQYASLAAAAIPLLGQSQPASADQLSGSQGSGHATSSTTPNFSANDAKIVRDLLFAWIYVTISEVGQDKTAALLISDLQNMITVTSNLELDIAKWQAHVASDPVIFAGIANLLIGSKSASALSSPWSGSHEHPLLTELKSSLG